MSETSQYAIQYGLKTDSARPAGQQSGRPGQHRNTLGRRSFSVAGPTVWNSLPDELRDQECTEGTSKHSLKTYLFAQH